MSNPKSPVLATVVFISALACTWSFDAQAQRKELDFNAGWKFNEFDDAAYSTVNYDDSEWTVLNVPHDYIYENGVSEGGSQKQFQRPGPWHPGHRPG